MVVDLPSTLVFLPRSMMFVLKLKMIKCEEIITTGETQLLIALLCNNFCGVGSNGFSFT